MDEFKTRHRVRIADEHRTYLKHHRTRFLAHEASPWLPRRFQLQYRLIVGLSYCEATGFVGSEEDAKHQGF